MLRWLSLPRRTTIEFLTPVIRPCHLAHINQTLTRPKHRLSLRARVQRKTTPNLVSTPSVLDVMDIDILLPTAVVHSSWLWLLTSQKRKTRKRKMSAFTRLIKKSSFFDDDINANTLGCIRQVSFSAPVVRCAFTKSADISNWKRATIFQTCTKFQDMNCKVIVES